MAAILSGVLAGLVAAWIWGWAMGSGFLLAMFWSLANFAVLATILRLATDPSGVRIGPLVGWVALKLFGLYGLAVVVLLHRWFPLSAFAVGLGWPLIIAVLRSLAPARSVPRSSRGQEIPGSGRPA